MKDRHIDQIMLCVVYGVCKVNKLKDVAFRKILEKYRLQPHSVPKVGVQLAFPSQISFLWGFFFCSSHLVSNVPFSYLFFKATTKFRTHRLCCTRPTVQLSLTQKRTLATSSNSTTACLSLAWNLFWFSLVPLLHPLDALPPHP
jgi:hypothetical protein